MSLLSLSRPCLPSFKIKSNKKPNDKNLSLALVSTLSLNPIASPKPTFLNTTATTATTNSLSPALAAWLPPKYVYPDPIPEFAIAETDRFRGELRKKLSKSKETFGDDIDAVVEVCAEIFSEFLHKEYGGPGTLLVEPFTDMLLALKEKKLPGAPVAARAALLWAQNYVDKDWELWSNPQPSK